MNHLFFTLIISLLLFSGIIRCHGQLSSIKGEFTDSKTNKKIENGQLSLYKDSATNKTIVIDRSFYIFDKLDTGRYILTFTSKGFQPKESTVYITKRNTIYACDFAMVSSDTSSIQNASSFFYRLDPDSSYWETEIQTPIIIKRQEENKYWVKGQLPRVVSVKWLGPWIRKNANDEVKQNVDLKNEKMFKDILKLAEAKNLPMLRRNADSLGLTLLENSSSENEMKIKADGGEYLFLLNKDAIYKVEFSKTFDSPNKCYAEFIRYLNYYHQISRLKLNKRVIMSNQFNFANIVYGYGYNYFFRQKQNDFGNFTISYQIKRQPDVFDNEIIFDKKPRYYLIVEIYTE